MLTSEPDCATYLFGEDENTPNTFHMFEQYANGRAGFEAHAKTPHYQAWTAFKATEPFSAPARVSYYLENMPAEPVAEPPAEPAAAAGGKAGKADAFGAPPAGFDWGGLY